MPMTAAEAEQTLRAGAGALQQGRLAEARAAFDQVAESGLANAQVWLLLAHTCRRQQDPDAEERALDRLLALDSNSLRGLLMKGDRRAAAGDDRAATSFYKRALAVAGALREVPADLQGELKRVGDWLAGADRRYREHLEADLARRGLGPGARSRRFQQSLDIMFGEKQPYFQQPTSYFFPELPQIQFYERERFEWAGALEAETDAMRDELAALLREEQALFRPYLVGSAERPRTDFHGLLDNPEWSSLYLWENGRPVEDNVRRCPRTFAALQKVPLAHIGVRAPVVMFSWLKPGARIPPHTGAMNARLICHLPLLVPGNGALRVGNEVREWEPGRLLIFDDTIEHEAWNDSAEDRVVLIFDIWRPELSEEEREAVAAMFAAVDSYGAG
jgi:Tfp pilus assembly protein PilF